MCQQKYRLTDDIVRELLPLRKADAHKGDAGRAVICAGSPGFTGAAALSSYAAVKAGAGLVALYTPLSSRDVLAGKLTEVMVHGLLERMPGILGGGATGDVVKNANAADVLAIGPGLGTSESTQQVVRDILLQVQVPVVIDADALTALQGHTEILSEMQAAKMADSASPVKWHVLSARKSAKLMLTVSILQHNMLKNGMLCWCSRERRPLLPVQTALFM